MKQLKFLLLLLLTGCAQNEPSIKTLWNDFQARQEIKAEKYEEALLRYIALLESDGGRAGTHSNIGVLLGKLQKPEDAQKSLQHALTLAQNDPQSLFVVNYNLGVFFGAQKKVPEALSYYQAALEIVPASVEVKTNIELLIQQQQQDQKDQKDQKDKEGEGENKPEDQNKDNKPGDDKDKDSKGDQKDKKDPKDGKGDKDDKDDKDKKDDKPQDQPRQNSPKYKPRPFQGDQLSEGDVKKILGELKNQEQKIRANFDKKEKGKSRNNEKDW